ncbi:MAG: hypothetical protein JW924_03320 [Fusobacteriaceae bacterium]|nr:hypothetical protein [Fusobacteriaceae bacterium]
MSIYRISRNIEKSTIDRIRTILAENSWVGITVEKTFARIYEIETPSICVRAGETIHKFVEVGTDATQREVQILVDIFAKNEGQMLDLKDTLVENLKHGWDYFEYNVKKEAGKDAVYDSKARCGRLEIVSLTEAPVNFNLPKSDLDIHDRHRWLLTITIRYSKVEE